MNLKDIHLKDIHVNLEVEDYKRLLHFCLHRGDLNLLISQSVKKLLKSLEEAEAKTQNLETQNLETQTKEEG